jgi:hypothetical protein
MLMDCPFERSGCYIAMRYALTVLYGVDVSNIGLAINVSWSLNQDGGVCCGKEV